MRPTSHNQPARRHLTRRHAWRSVSAALVVAISISL